MTIAPTPYKINDAAELLTCSVSDLLRNNQLIPMLLVPENHHVKVEYSPTALETLKTLKLYGIDVVNIQYLQLDSVQIDNIDMHGQHIDVADKFFAGFYRDSAGGLMKITTVESIFEAHPIYNNPELMAIIQPFKDERAILRLECKILKQDDGMYRPSGSGLTFTIDAVYIEQNQIEAIRGVSSGIVEKRAHAIVRHIKASHADLDIMHIPLDEKAKILDEFCDTPSELKFTRDTFNKAWQYASSNGLLAIEGRDRFIRS